MGEVGEKVLDDIWADEGGRSVRVIKTAKGLRIEFTRGVGEVAEYYASLTTYRAHRLAEVLRTESSEAMTDQLHSGEPETPQTDRRGSFLLLNDFERLEEWCRLVRVVFDGEAPYMVGSVNRRPDYRDVDLRLILDDAEFDAAYTDPVKVRLLNRAISTWGQRETGLPIDFQVQRMTEANAAFGGGYRNPMGLRDWSALPTSGTPGGRNHD